MPEGEGRNRTSYQRTDEEVLKRTEFLLRATEVIRRQIVARDRRNAKKTGKAPKRRPRRRPKASD